MQKLQIKYISLCVDKILVNIENFKRKTTKRFFSDCPHSHGQKLLHWWRKFAFIIAKAQFLKEYT